MNHTLQKLLKSSILCCTIFTTTHSTETAIDTQIWNSIFKQNIDKVENDKISQFIKKQGQFYKILLYIGDKDSNSYYIMKKNFFEDRSNSLSCIVSLDAPQKIHCIKDVILSRLGCAIPSKYIQLFSKNKEIQHEGTLKRILDKHRKKDTLLIDPIAIRYKILYFPLLCLIYKGNTE